MAARLTTYVVVGIVAATLIAGLIVGAQRDDSSGPVDLIVFNAKVHTGDPSSALAEAVAVRGNQILRVGSNREINRLRRPQTTIVDARGAAVLPGFNDADIQFITGGLALDAIDLLDAVSTDEIAERVSTWAEANPDRPWVIGRGWHADSFPPGGPTRQMLDAAVADRPALLLSHDGRSAWLNSKALRLARVTRRTPDPPGGMIVKEARTGEPTGVLKEAAMGLANRLLPPVTTGDRARALRDAIAEAHRNGITSVQDATAHAEDFIVYDSARRAGELNLRVYSSVTVEKLPGDDVFRQLEALSSRYPDDPVFKVGGVRIALDGPVDSWAAAMMEPYENRPSADAGDTTIAPDDLNRLVRLLDARGWQISTAATGDRAVRMALDAYDHAVRSNPRPERGRRHRIDRIGIVDPADVPRFARLNVIACLQPGVGETDLWVRALGSERVERARPYASLAAGAGRLALGTGWPAGPMSPLAAIGAVVNRALDDGGPAAERLTVKRAVAALTSGPAYASFDEQRKGSLKPGMLADIVVLTDDIFDASDGLSSASVAVTIFDGKIVYRRNAAELRRITTP